MSSVLLPFPGPAAGRKLGDSSAGKPNAVRLPPLLEEADNRPDRLDRQGARVWKDQHLTTRGRWKLPVQRVIAPAVGS